VKTIVIVNPVSGRGRAKKLIPTIERFLRASGLEFDLLQSERPWHTAELAESAARQGIDTVVVAGGDGTVNEAINGLIRISDEVKAVNLKLVETINSAGQWNNIFLEAIVGRGVVGGSTSLGGNRAHYAIGVRE